MTEHFATVGYDNDEGDWTVCYGERIHSRHATKQEAIDTATGIDPVNRVLAFTKGRSNMKTVIA